MKNKLLALVNAIAVLSLAVLPNAALAANISTTVQVNGGTTLATSTAVTTIRFTPTTALTNGSTFTVSYPSTYTDTSFVSGDVSVANTGGSFSVTSVNTSSNTISVSVTTAGTGTSQVTLTLSGSHLLSPAVAESSSFGVSTSVGDTGVALVYVGNANLVTVTASVLPTLTFNLSTTSLSLGTVGTSAYSSASLNAEVGTNNSTGATIQFNSTNLTNGSHNFTKAATASGSGEGYKYTAATNSGDQNGGTISGSATDQAMPSTATTIYSNTVPELNAGTNDTALTVAAQASALTPAGNYSDTLTFTAFANP